MWFTSVDLATGFFQLPIVEADRQETASRDAFGQLWEYMRCGFGLNILPPSFASMVMEILGNLKGNGVDNYPGDIVLCIADFDRHVALMAPVLSHSAGEGALGKIREVAVVSREPGVRGHGCWPAGRATGGV